MSHIDIVFDGPPGPESGRFVEVEDAGGKGICFGEWTHRPDGYWALRIPAITSNIDGIAELLAALELILPMAKGYAAAHPVGSNDLYIKSAIAAIAKATQEPPA